MFRRNANPDARQPRVLVIEDDLGTRRMLSVELKGLGCDVQSVASAEEAEPLLQGETPSVDVIVLDFILPGANGPQFMRKLHREPRTRSIPVVPFTSLVERHDKIAGDVMDALRVNNSAETGVPHPMVSKGTPGNILAVPGSLILAIGHVLVKHKIPIPTAFRARMRLAGEQLG